jgi:hypothetical protein
MAIYFHIFIYLFIYIVCILTLESNLFFCVRFRGTTKEAFVEDAIQLALGYGGFSIKHFKLQYLHINQLMFMFHSPNLNFCLIYVSNKEGGALGLGLGKLGTPFCH